MASMCVLRGPLPSVVKTMCRPLGVNVGHRWPSSVPSRRVSDCGTPPEPGTVNSPVSVAVCRQNPEENTIVSSAPQSAVG